MIKNKETRIIIVLECINCRQNKNEVLNNRNKGISRYLTTKNRRNTPNRIELKKYCSICNEHTLHNEIK